MVATGAMTMLVAFLHLAGRGWRTLTVMAFAGTFSVALMSATNFALHSDFRWLLLMPALMWLAGVLCYLWEGARKPMVEE